MPPPLEMNNTKEPIALAFRHLCSITPGNDFEAELADGEKDFYRHILLLLLYSAHRQVLPPFRSESPSRDLHAAHTLIVSGGVSAQSILLGATLTTLTQT
jgi:hypothetical protein